MPRLPSSAAEGRAFLLALDVFVAARGPWGRTSDSYGRDRNRQRRRCRHREPDTPEVTMSTTDVNTKTELEPSDAATVPERFEVTTVPVTDVDRAKAFYQRLGWRLDIDFKST
jgi:hypothetical protein